MNRVYRPYNRPQTRNLSKKFYDQGLSTQECHQKLLELQGQARAPSYASVSRWFRMFRAERSADLERGKFVKPPDVGRVIHQLLEGKKSVSELSNEHGVHPTTIGRWKKNYLRARPSAYLLDNVSDGEQIEGEEYCIRTELRENWRETSEDLDENSTEPKLRDLFEKEPTVPLKRPGNYLVRASEAIKNRPILPKSLTGALRTKNWLRPENRRTIVVVAKKPPTSLPHYGHDAPTEREFLDESSTSLAYERPSSSGTSRTSFEPHNRMFRIVKKKHDSSKTMFDAMDDVDTIASSNEVLKKLVKADSPDDHVIVTEVVNEKELDLSQIFQ
ncbi:unnamed protein product [Bursaphelenchus okinawaensis]|uniref:Mos1 transposase HTH domain-containing protein n=1 Tax=Bursaphelenchus okinawaensis TaxID=465554 RepID=A0A811JVU2_9BILA|nr:unnamed protein product [Bursaphelenchus okinawaensis]CAG9085401.1 unnamed protein product [Bursaphelenchus okinawaensis]